MWNLTTVEPVGRMSSQKSIFLTEEGDAWFRRNRLSDPKPAPDSVVSAMNEFGLKPNKLLEIGCSDGWRLDIMHSRFGIECFGVDPSRQAIEIGKPTLEALERIDELKKLADVKHDAMMQSWRSDAGG